MKEFLNCNGCTKKRIIVNVKHGLCQFCNNKRLHKGVKKVYNFERKKPKPVSKKQKEINGKIKSVYQSIDSSREHKCSGCDAENFPLSHSHIIPRSRRKDLESDPRNIVFDCLSIGEHKGCHEKWDGSSEEKKSLLNYHERIEYIKSVDKEYYHLITLKG